MAVNKFIFFDKKGNPTGVEADSVLDLVEKCEKHQAEAKQHLATGYITKWLRDESFVEIADLSEAMRKKYGGEPDLLKRFMDRARHWVDGVTLTGKVVDRSKQGIEGVQISAIVSEPDGVDVTIRLPSGIDGSYEFKSIPRGQHVEVQFESKPTLAGRSLKALEDTTLYLQPYNITPLPDRQYGEEVGPISGKVERVSNTGEAVKFADVEVQLLDAERTTTIDRTTTKGDGRFSFTKTAFGALWLKFPPQVAYQGDVFTPSQPFVQIVVSPDSPYELRLPIQYTMVAAKVVGQVVGAGKGLKDVKVELRDQHGTVVTKDTDGTGAYVFSNVMPGSVELRFPRIPKVDDQTWELERDETRLQVLQAISNQVTQARLVVYRLEKHLLRYKVTTDGKPAPGKLVEVRDKDDNVIRRRTENDGIAYFDLPNGGDFTVQVYDDERYTVEPIKRKISVHSTVDDGIDIPSYTATVPPPNGEQPPSGMVTTPSKFDELTAFPLMTESRGTVGGTPSATRGMLTAGPLGQVVEGAIQQVLGWKPRNDDPKGFVGALTQSFKATEVDGTRQFTWMPRTYAVQTDLSGGLTGAQASLFSRAQNAIDQMLPLLEGLEELRVDLDKDNLDALRALVRSQITELVNELGTTGGPRVARVDQLFNVLLGPAATNTTPEMDPDKVAGQLGGLRDILGMVGGKVNTVEEEQNLTNFRILVDYLTSLRQSWLANREYFERPSTKPFFGTQLVLLSRQLSVVAESVDELRLTMDSVFIGNAERQTLPITFPTLVTLPDQTTEPAATNTMFLEELLSWVSTFASTEGPTLIQDGGKYGVQYSFLPTAKMLRNLVSGAQKPQNVALPNGSQPAPGQRAVADLPSGYQTARVQRALQELALHLHELVSLAVNIEAPTFD